MRESGYSRGWQRGEGADDGVSTERKKIVSFHAPDYNIDERGMNLSMQSEFSDCKKWNLRDKGNPYYCNGHRCIGLDYNDHELHSHAFVAFCNENENL